jgi:stress-induced-phosphoprotein 1
MREYVRAIEAVQDASEHDEEKKHTAEIQDQIWKCQQAQFSQRDGESDEDVMQRAMRDPEVAVSMMILLVDFLAT